jgi:MFS family permease
LSAPTPAGKDRSFAALVGAQFFGAFNDNLFKQLVLLLAAGTLFPGKDLQGVAFAALSLPFVIFSGLAGDLSERYSKRTIIVWMKVAEIFICLGTIWALMSMSWTLMLVVLAILGTQSAFFGPSKYGVIPEIVKADRLIPANGMITMTTFLAVLTGQALAGPLMDAFGPRADVPRLWVPGLFCVGFAVIGTVMVYGMRPLPAMNPNQHIGKSPFGDLFKTIKTLRQDRRLFRVLLLNSFLWFNSGVLNQAVNGLKAPGYLALEKDSYLSILLSTISVGIILGSLAAPRFAARFGLGKVTAAGVFGMLTLQVGLLAIGTVVGPECGLLRSPHPVDLHRVFRRGFHCVGAGLAARRPPTRHARPDLCGQQLPQLPLLVWCGRLLPAGQPGGPHHRAGTVGVGAAGLVPLRAPRRRKHAHRLRERGRQPLIALASWPPQPRSPHG